MCLVLSGSVLHSDIALLWKFTNHDDFALTVRYRSFFPTFLCMIMLMALTEVSNDVACPGEA